MYAELAPYLDEEEKKWLENATKTIKSGIVSLVADINGTFDNITHKENLQIENFKIANKAYDLAFSNLKIDTNKNNVAYINNIILNSEYTYPVKLPLLKLHIDRDSVKIPDTNIFMPNSKKMQQEQKSVF